MTIYSEKLRDPRWQKKRLEIFNRDGWMCQMCGESKKELVVHHESYDSGLEPWEYSDDKLKTICVDCHEDEHGIIEKTKLNNVFNSWLDGASKSDGIFISMGVETGFNNFDNAIKGFQKSTLTVIASRTGMGKHDFILNIIKNNKWDEFGVVYFSIHKSSDKISEQLISMIGNNSRRSFCRDNAISVLQNNEIDVERIMFSNVYIDASPNLSLKTIARRIRKLKNNQNIGIAIIDSVDLLSVNKKDHIEIVFELKKLSNELDIPIVLTCNISSSVDDRACNRPILRDLGDLQTYADCVIFLYREKFYYPHRLKDTAEFIFAKNQTQNPSHVCFDYNSKTGIFYETENEQDKIYQ